MKRLHFIFIKNRLIMILIALAIIACAIPFIFLKLNDSTVINFDPNARIVVLDAGHGGIDGGTSKGGILEKDINLDLVKRIKAYLEGIGYVVILTRDTDRSLEGLTVGSGSRHLRDLKARTNIINSSSAGLFLSIHVNCHTTNLNADGSIVLYNERLLQNKSLAYCIQRALNNIVIDGKKRTVHNPLNSPNFYLLNNTKIPGAIIETVFISNQKERELITQDKFKDEISLAVVNGIETYMNQNQKVNQGKNEPDIL